MRLLFGTWMIGVLIALTAHAQPIVYTKTIITIHRQQPITVLVEKEVEKEKENEDEDERDLSIH